MFQNALHKIPINDRRRELIASRRNMRIKRLYGTTEVTPPEPNELPTFLTADEAIGLLAYGRSKALDGPVPGAPPVFERWSSRVVGWTGDERHYPLVHAMRLVLARVRWWQQRKRGSAGSAHCPVPPLDRIMRAHIRWAIRTHGGTEAASALRTLTLLRGDLRALHIAQDSHDEAIERATAFLCDEIASEHVVAYGRPGMWRTKRFTSGEPDRIPPKYFINPLNTILDGWATSGWDEKVQDWADWKGPEWGDVRIQRDDILRLLRKLQQTELPTGHGEGASTIREQAIDLWLPDIRDDQMMDGPVDTLGLATVPISGPIMEPEVIAEAPRFQIVGPASALVDDRLRPKPRWLAHRLALADRFRTTQRERREWICFAEIADWLARANGDIIPDEQRRVRAYAELTESIEACEFTQNGKERVLFLNTTTPMIRLSRENARFLRKQFPDGMFETAYLSKCWIPISLCRRWFAAKRLPLPVWLPEVITDQHKNIGLKVDVSQIRANTPSATITEPSEWSPRKRGRKGDLTKRIANQIVADIDSGKHTWTEIDREKHEILASRYGAKSRDTLKKALAQVEDILRARNSDK